MDQVQKYYFIFISLLALTVVVYYPGLTNHFDFDDFPNIVDNQLLHVKNPSISNFWQAAWSGNSSSFGRPLAYLSFSINSHFSGLDAQAMKVTNLVIHLLVGILLFFLSRLLLNHINLSKKLKFNVNFISALACGVWLLHPLNLTSVLYVVQRMTSLCALFSVCAMLCYTYFRIRQTKHKGQWLPLIISTSLFALLSFLAKENAVLLIFYITCIEFFILKFSTFNPNDRTILKACFISAHTIIIVSIVMFLTFNSEWLKNAYDFRVFNLSERILTEFRILVWYLRMIMTPDITEMSLYLDDFSLSTSLFSPISTILSITLLLTLLVIGYLVRTKYILVSFGIFWFFSGHLLESTIIPLELAFEHRNYLPSFGIYIALIFIAEHLLNNSKLRRAVIISCIAWIALISYTTLNRVEQWKDPLNLALSHVQNHPNSARAHSVLAGKYASYVRSSDGEINDEIFNKVDFHFKKAAMLNSCCSSNLIARLAFYNLQGRDLPKNEFAQLINSLKQNKIDPGTHIALRNLTMCQIDGHCSLSHDDYMEIMYAPLSREELNKLYLPYLLVSLSEYYAAVLNDYDTAINLVRIIIEERPKELNYRFLLIKFLAHSRLYEDALNELEFIEKNDRFRIYVAHSTSWKNLIKSSIANNSDG